MNFRHEIVRKTCSMCSKYQPNTKKSTHTRIHVQMAQQDKIKKPYRIKITSTSFPNDLHAIQNGFGHLDNSSIRANSHTCSDLDHTSFTSIHHKSFSIMFPINRGQFSLIFQASKPLKCFQNHYSPYSRQSIQSEKLKHVHFTPSILTPSLIITEDKWIERRR